MCYPTIENRFSEFLSLILFVAAIARKLENHAIAALHG